MGQFFDSREFLRTPPFVRRGLYDDEPQLPPLPERIMRQDEQPSAGGLSGMIAAAPLDMPPPQSPRDVPPPRQRITLPDVPLPPKVGKLRQILGGAVTMFVPPIGDEIRQPGYNRARQEHANKIERLTLEGKLNETAAQEESHLATAGASGARRQAELARAGKLNAERDYVGKRPITVNEKERLYDPATKNVLLDASNNDDIPITKELGQHLELSPDKDGRYWIPRSSANSLITSKKTPDEPSSIREYKAIVRGKSPGMPEPEVNAEVSKMMATDRDAKLGLTGAQTNRANRPTVRRDGADAGDDDVIIQDLLSSAPRTDWNNLGIKEQNRIRPKLIGKGWTEPVKLGVGQRGTLESIDSIVPRLQEMLGEIEQKGSLPGTGIIAGHLPNIMTSEDGLRTRIRMGDVFSTIAKIRSGGAIPKPEMERLEAFLATQTQAGGFNKVALQELLGSMQRSRQHILTRPPQGGVITAAPGGNQNTGNGAVLMKKTDPATGKVITRNVFSDKVAAAKSAGYQIVGPE